MSLLLKNLTFSICLAALLALAACSSEPTLSPEQQVKLVLEQVEEAAQKRSLSGMMQHLSDTYKDHQGNNKDAMQRYAQMQIIRNQNINIYSLIRSLNVEGEVATVEMSVAMASRKVDLSEQSNRLNADTARFSLLLSLENEQWKISSVSWKRGW